MQKFGLCGQINYKKYYVHTIGPCKGIQELPNRWNKLLEISCSYNATLQRHSGVTRLMKRQSIYLLLGECYSIIFKEELYSRVKVYNRENNKILIWQQSAWATTPYQMIWKFKTLSYQAYVSAIFWFLFTALFLKY